MAVVLQLARETTYLAQDYTLPDGRTIRVGAERFQAAEALFAPDLIGQEGDGISELIFKCIQVPLNELHCRPSVKRHIPMRKIPAASGPFRRCIEAITIRSVNFKY